MYYMLTKILNKNIVTATLQKRMLNQQGQASGLVKETQEYGLKPRQSGSTVHPFNYYAYKMPKIMIKIFLE